MYENLRIATPEDEDLVVELTTKALNTTRYAPLSDQDSIRTLAKNVLSSGQDERIILLYKDYGMIAAAVIPFLFGLSKTAVVLGIWVEESERGNKAGKELIEAIEYWANKLGCKSLTLSAVNGKMKKYFKKLGYSEYEVAMVKEFS